MAEGQIEKDLPFSRFRLGFASPPLQGFPQPVRFRFDRVGFLPYTLCFVRVSFAQAVNAPGVWRVQLEGSLLPEHCKTEWERRAAGMGRQSRKAE